MREVRGGAAAESSTPTPPLFGEAEFFAWLGGYTDGEGYIGWDGTARVVFTTTCLPILEWLQIRLEAGTLRQLIRYKDALSVKPTYQLTFCGPEARRLLFRLRVFLFEKRAQADLVLTLEPCVRGKRLQPGEHERRLAVRRLLREMRHREYT